MVVEKYTAGLAVDGKRSLAVTRESRRSRPGQEQGFNPLALGIAKLCLRGRKFRFHPLRLYRVWPLSSIEGLLNRYVDFNVTLFV